jgi:hypothetical protein
MTTLHRQYSTGSDSEYRSHRSSSTNPYAKKKTPPYVPHRLEWVMSSKAIFDLARQCGVPEEVARDETLLNIYRDFINQNRDIEVDRIMNDDEKRVFRCYRKSLERFNDDMKKGVKAKQFVHTPPIIYRRARTAGFPHFIATNFHLLERLYLGVPKDDEKRWMVDYKITIQNFRDAGGVKNEETLLTPTPYSMTEPMNLEDMFSEYDSLGTSPSSFDSMLSRSTSDSSDNSDF